jgi:hypothetical protein
MEEVSEKDKQTPFIERCRYAVPLLFPQKEKQKRRLGPPGIAAANTTDGSERTSTISHSIHPLPISFPVPFDPLRI